MSYADTEAHNHPQWAAAEQEFRYSSILHWFKKSRKAIKHYDLLSKI